MPALIARDWRITRSYRAALATDLAFGFLNLCAYYFISHTLKVTRHSNLGRAPSYFAFAAVGVALAVVLQAAVSGVSRRVREEQLTGTLEALLAQPVSAVELALGLAGFPFLFAVMRAFVYLLLAGAVLGLSFAHTDWLGLFSTFVVSGLAFAGIGIVLAAIVLVFKRAEAVGGVAVFGMSLVGGAFFAVSVLPGWLRGFATILPTRYAFSSARDAMFGGPDWVTPMLTLLGIGALTLVGGLLLFSVGLRIVMRKGTLNQY